LACSNGRPVNPKRRWGGGWIGVICNGPTAMPIIRFTIHHQAFDVKNRFRKNQETIDVIDAAVRDSMVVEPLDIFSCRFTVNPAYLIPSPRAKSESFNRFNLFSTTKIVAPEMIPQFVLPLSQVLRAGF
jgi:hypothetical protein